MKKAVLISIKPEWCEKILSGEKTIEVRKTKPKIAPPFKCYIYCTKGLSCVVFGENRVYDGERMVIGEFMCKKIQQFDCGSRYNVTDEEIRDMCLTHDQFYRYGGGKPLYGFGIYDLKIYDYPKNLKEFTRPCNYYHDCFPCIHAITDAETNEFSGCDNVVETAPQSWCYVEELV